MSSKSQSPIIRFLQSYSYHVNIYVSQCHLLLKISGNSFQLNVYKPAYRMCCFLLGITDSNKKVIIDAGRNGSVICGGDFSGSLLPFSLISSTNIMNIRVPPFEGTGSHAFTFNITSTDHPGLSYY